VRRSLLVLAVAGALALSACGSSGSAARDTTTSTTSALSAADQRIGRAALLRTADAPGYQQIAPQQSVLADLSAAAISTKACAPYLAGKQHRLGTGRATGLQRGSTVVDSSNAIFADDASAQAELELFRAPTMAKCLQAVYQTKDTPFDVAPATISALGDDRVAYRITPTGQPDPPAVIEVVVIRVGHALLSQSITGAVADVAAFLDGPVTKAVDRVRTAEA
jgi:hypothetical protein